MKIRSRSANAWQCRERRSPLPRLSLNARVSRTVREGSGLSLFESTLPLLDDERPQTRARRSLPAPATAVVPNVDSRECGKSETRGASPWMKILD